jgi:hypothetical protein
MKSTTFTFKRKKDVKMPGPVNEPVEVAIRAAVDRLDQASDLSNVAQVVVTIGAIVV